MLMYKIFLTAKVAMDLAKCAKDKVYSLRPLRFLLFAFLAVNSNTMQILL